MKAAKAILLGVLAFSLLFFCFTGFVEYLAFYVDDFIGLLPWLSLLAYLLYVAAGFVASAYSGRLHMLVGLATGVACGLVAAVVFGVGEGARGVATTLAFGSVLGVIGGALCRLTRQFRRYSCE